MQQACTQLQAAAHHINRSDIFIQHDMINFHIVEFKCCKDTDPDKQHQTAMDQHQEVVDRWSYGTCSGGAAHHVPDTPYHDWSERHNSHKLQDTMDLLGVSKAEAKRCAAKMHIIAVSYVDKTMMTKKRGVG
jgi:hypothetical protein